MKRTVVTLVIVIFAAGLIFGGYCIANKDTFKAIQSSKEYLTSKKYQIVSYEGEKNYILKKEQLLGLPYSMIWGVQKVKPESYLGKNVYEYSFKIKNHPLDNVQKNSRKQTIATVMMVDSQVIGGYSLPDYDEVMIGDGIYSLDGKTLEEVTGMNYQVWGDSWVKRFK